MKNQQSLDIEMRLDLYISSRSSVNQFLNLFHIEEEEEEEEVKATTYNKNKYNIVLSHAVFEAD